MLFPQGHSHAPTPDETYLRLPDRYAAKKEEGRPKYASFDSISFSGLFSSNSSHRAHAVKGLAKAQNFILNFFKKSADTSIQVDKHVQHPIDSDGDSDGDGDTGSDDDEGRNGSRRGPASISGRSNRSLPGVTAAGKSGLLLYSVQGDGDGAASPSGRSTPNPQQPSMRRGQPPQSSRLSLPSRPATERGLDGEESEAESSPWDAPHLPKISPMASSGSLKGASSLRLNRGSLPAMYGSARLKDSVCMFAPGSLQPGVGTHRNSAREIPLADEELPSEQQPSSESLPRLSALLQGGRSSRLFSPVPPPPRESSGGCGSGNSGRFSPAPPPPRESNGGGGSGNSGRFSRVSSRSMARRAADAGDDTEDDGRSSHGRLSSPGINPLPANLRQAYDSLPALPKPSRMPLRPGSRTAAMQLDDELDEALMGSAGASLVKFQLTRRSLTSRQEAADGDLPDGEEDDILRSMSSPMVRMPSMRRTRALQQQQQDYRSERQLSSPIPGLILGRDEASGGSSPIATRSGSLGRNHSGGFADMRSVDDAEGGGRLLTGALDMLHRVQNSAEAGASALLGCTSFVFICIPSRPAWIMGFAMHFQFAPLGHPLQSST